MDAVMGSSHSGVSLQDERLGDSTDSADGLAELAPSDNGHSPAAGGARGTGPTTPASPATPAANPKLHGAGVGLTLLGVFLLGFLAYLYGFSGIQEARAQTTMYPGLRIELGNQVAPLGATTPGSPVAILDVPAIGIKNMVVVEGTSPENLTLGPGHLRDTPLPGQSGLAEIFGRRITFGGPFAHLTQLRHGDKITFITGQGRSVYTVMAWGDTSHLVQDPAPNRLLMVTACSATVPSTYCYLDADLSTTPVQDPGGRPGITPSELPLSGDNGALVLTLVWGLALVIASATATVAAARWSPWLTYLAVMPAALAVLWNLYQSLAALLPNMY